MVLRQSSSGHSPLSLDVCYDSFLLEYGSDPWANLSSWRNFVVWEICISRIETMNIIANILKCGEATEFLVLFTYLLYTENHLLTIQ